MYKWKVFSFKNYKFKCNNAKCNKQPMRHRKVRSCDDGKSRVLACWLFDLITEYMISHMMKDLPVIQHMFVLVKFLCFFRNLQFVFLLQKTVFYKRSLLFRSKLKRKVVSFFYEVNWSWKTFCRRCVGIIHRLMIYQKRCKIRLNYQWKELWSGELSFLKSV